MGKMEATLGDLLTQRKSNELEAKEELVNEFKEKMTQTVHDSLAEKSILQALLFAPEQTVEIVEEHGLMASDFFSQANAFTMEAIEFLLKKRKPVDTLSVCDELNRRDRLRKVGGATFLTDLSKDVMFTSLGTNMSAQLVVDCSRRRTLSEMIFKGMMNCQTGTHRTIEVIDELRRGMSEVEVRGGASRFDLQAVAKTVLESLPALGGKRDTIPTGFIDLDNLIGGMSGGDLVIVAGRPSMGKTCWGLDVARKLAVEKAKPVLLFSLEMTTEQLTERLIGAEAGVSTKASHLNDNEKAKVIEAAGIIGDAPITIDDAAGLSVADIRARTRKIANHTPLSLVVVDYIQLLSSSRDLKNRTGEMSETSNGLKRLARELRVPVVAISQLNRGPEARLDKRPLMSDLRESGAIEQDADMVMLLYREEYYGKEKTPDEAKGVAECIISKNRNGPTGMVRLKFQSEIPRFDNLIRNEILYSHEYND